MTPVLIAAIFFCGFFIPGIEGATSTVSTIGSDPVLGASPDFIQFLIQSFNGMQGASIFASAGILVQVVMRSLDQPFAKHFLTQRGISRLTVIAALTFLITPIGLVSGAGLTIAAALIHSSTLTAFIVLLNQIYDETKKPKTASVDKDSEP